MTRHAPFTTRRLWLACAGLPLLLAMPAGAAALAFKDWKPGAPCFARIYDAKHLAAHPKQLLTHFALSASRYASTVKGEFLVDFSFRVRGHSEVFEGNGICHGGPYTATCGVEGDGGHFTMKADEDGLLLTLDDVGVEGETAFSPELGARSDDRLVRLRPASKSACRFN
jgi:hypothetical protein